MLDILAITTPIFLIIGLGYLARAGGIIEAAPLQGVGTFVMFFALPALVIRALTQNPLEEVFDATYLLAYGIGSLAIFTLGLVLTLGLERKPLANGASVGGGTELAPDADPSDGHIDVLIATPESFSAKTRYAVGVLLRRHPEHENVRTLRARTVAVTGSEFACSADGELSPPVRSRTWRLEVAAYALAVPRGTDGEAGPGARGV